MRKGILLLVSVIGLLAAASAPAMTVTYDIKPHTIGNWSGSFIHRATHFGGASDLDLDSDGFNDSLYTSGRSRRISGSLTGNWNGTTLTDITGSLWDFAVTGGSLGGAYYSETNGVLAPLWSLELEGAGTFYFEDMWINQINQDTLTLWGQNLQAYLGSSENGKHYGLDLYGVSLPEPSSIAILLLGLLAIPVVLARRRRAARQGK
jgi:hypothetical protein